jgi:hypothetical protein
VLDSQRVQAAEPQIGLDVPLRIDDDGSAAALVTDEIGGAGQVLVDDLTEEDGYSAFAELRIAFRIVLDTSGRSNSSHIAESRLAARGRTR